MAYDPNWPPTNAELESAPFREQFQGLKALIDAQAVLLANLVPIGAVIAWFKDTPGVPPLPPNFVECNGQMLVDPESSLNGQTMPDINNSVPRFVRGALNSGGTGGLDSFGLALADNSGTQPVSSFVTPDFSPGASPIPPYIDAVYIIRVK